MEILGTNEQEATCTRPGMSIPGKGGKKHIDNLTHCIYDTEKRAIQ